MPAFYRRQIRTQVAGLTIEGLRQTLSIERHSDPTQNRGSLAVYNLSGAASNRMIPPAGTGEIRERGIPITVDAGYPDTIAQVFEGEVQRGLRSREGTDVITRVTLGDQVRSVRRLGGVTNRSYPGVEPVRSIARDIIGDMGLMPGPLTAIPESAVAVDFRRTGSAGGGLESLLRNASPSLAHLHWFELDGVVRINAPGDGQPDAPTIPLSPETGLIESPIPTDEGAECRMFLNPAVVVGCLIDLQSSALAGLWKVIALRHSGDNWSGVFETAVDMRREGQGRVQIQPPAPLAPGILGEGGTGTGTGTGGGGGTGPATGGGSGAGGNLEILGTLDPDSGNIRWLHTDVSGWDQTSTITGVTVRDVPAGGITINHTQSGQWPSVNVGGTVVEGNPWIFGNIGGTWYGATYEWNRPGQTTKLNVAGGHGPPSRELGPHIKRPPLSSWVPKSGEIVGFMVSTPARTGAQGTVQARSQIVLVKWP